MYKKCIKTWLLIFFVSYIINLPAIAKPTQKDCYEQFNDISISEIQKIFSNPESWTIYQGQEGYLLFTKKSPNISRMYYLFQLVSQALGKDFKKLGWQQYRGSVEDFHEERKNILDEKGNLKKEYLGMQGYTKYAAEYHEGNMFKTYKNVSAILNKMTFKKLGWKQYQGSVESFNKERRRILDETGAPKEKYIGTAGYARYSARYHGENIRKAFKNVSVVLDRTIFKQLGWKTYDGSIENLLNEQQQILDENGHPKEEYLGMDGYTKYAKKYYKGNMLKAFQNVSAVLDKTIFQQLGWQQYYGSVKGFLKERNQILDKQGNVKQEYLGMEGYAEYAKKYHESLMQKAFHNVSTALDNKVFQQLGWQKYYGSVESFLRERSQILDEQGNLKEKYIGIIGYARYATQYHEKNMLKAYRNVSAALDKTIFQQLGWQRYQGSLYALSKERKQILDERGNVKQKYLNIEGYKNYAVKYHEGDMQKAFQNVSAVLDKTIFQQLGWQQYHGSVEDVYKERKQILYENGNIKKDYVGMDGYINYAKKYYRQDMKKTFTNVSAILDDFLFQQLGWQQYHNSIKDFHKEKEQILDDNGHPKEEFIGMAGYINYATEYYEQNMQKAFQNVSAVLDKTIFQQLGWQHYQGLAEDFLKERSQILDGTGQIKKEYMGMEGYANYAKEYHGGDMHKAFTNASAVLGRSFFHQLEWQVYRGLVNDFLIEKDRILDENGNIKEEYMGMEGYAGYAAKYHNQDMLKVFQNISAVLGGHLRMKELGLKWKMFKGSVSEYYSLLQLFKSHLVINFKGLEGQREVARRIFKGNLNRTYRNVSNLRELLFGSREAFNELNWSAILK